MLNISLIAHFAYGAISGGKQGHSGGVERQTSMTARWLAAQGHRVNLVTWDEGQMEEISIIDGVRVIKMCRRDEGVTGMRFFHPRWTSLVRALHLSEADVYYQNCAEYVTGQVALWCKRTGKKFIYSVANDVDCYKRLPEMRTIRERVLYRYGLRKADAVIVQTIKQRELLKSEFSVDSVVLPMPCPGPTVEEFNEPSPPDSERFRIAWVARITTVKRLDMLLDLANLIPEAHFDVAGTPDVDDEYSLKVIERGRSAKNVTMHGRVERERMPEIYRNASFLCCTAIYEGFPNTFLEAWSYGIPVISTFDPDDLILRRNLGATGKDVYSLAEGIRGLARDQMRWLEVSRNARQYYFDNHTVDEVMRRYEALFLEVQKISTQRVAI